MGEKKQQSPAREPLKISARRISDSQLQQGKQAPRESQTPGQKPSPGTKPAVLPTSETNEEPISKGEVQPAPREARKPTEDSLSEDDDAMDIDEGDVAANEDKFEKHKKSLEAQKIDVGTRYYRASTPLENLEMLGRISLEDPSSFFRKRSPPPVSVASAPDDDAAGSDPTALEDELPAEGENEDQSEDLDLVTIERISPSPIHSPEIHSLPFLAIEPLTPISELDVLQEGKMRQEKARRTVTYQLKRQFSERSAEDEELREEYMELYIPWRHQFQELDRQKEREEQENQDGAEAVGVCAEAQMSPTATAAVESRRKRAFGSEYDTERAIQLSLETEREAQAKREREAEQAQPDYEKEALIPTLIPDDELETRKFEDMTSLRDANQALTFYQLQPFEDTFDKQEHDVFAQNFKEYPKKFGKIAQGLTGRSYKDCIIHYYATKWNGQYKPPRDKRKKVKGPRMRTASSIQGRPKANALISNLGDLRPDLYDGDEATAPVMAVTDSGRPRRAAAPTLFREKESDDQVPANITPAKKKVEALADQGPDKFIRKPRATTKERPKRAKAQTTAARQKSISPEKVDLGPKGAGMDGQAEAEKANPRELEVANGLAQLHAGQGQTSHSNPRFMPSQVSDQPPGSVEPIKATKNISSYWSVPEVNVFPSLLEHFGTDWQSIANHMQTKTVTMVSTRRV